MPKSVQRCVTKRSSSTNEPSSTRKSMRSRAVSLPFLCCAAMRSGPPPASASSRMRCRRSRGLSVLLGLVIGSERSGEGVLLQQAAAGTAVGEHGVLLLALGLEPGPEAALGLALDPLGQRDAAVLRVVEDHAELHSLAAVWAVRLGHAHECGSSTSSINTPPVAFGCTNATRVPCEPGFGCSSIIFSPAFFSVAIAAAQSSTRQAR